MNERLKCKPKSIKLLEENMGQKHHNIVSDNNFLAMTPKTQVTNRKKYTKWTS